ncbi:MAG: M4 family metallopeptidase, partial [Anaerolineales bacterium]
SSGVRWQMGEDVPVFGAIRDMSNPPAFSDPDKITSGNYWTSSADNGGVHSNSGINNKAAFLMVDGGTFNSKTVTGMGITKTAAIYYEVQTALLTSGSDYGDLYNALYQGCLNLVGGPAGITNADCQEVRDATDAVEMNLEPSPGFNPEAATCPLGQPPSVLFSDDLESGTGNWQFSAISGSSAWGSTTDYAQSGSTTLYANDALPNSDSVVSMISDVSLPAASNLYLWFAHAYDFEEPDYDGGWLEYSTNSGGSWSDAGGLVNAGKSYDGTIATGFGNPNGGQSAFLDTSHGYVSTRVNLSGLAGQSVRFRWRQSTDGIIGDLGWFVDDVMIYTCSGTTYSIYLPLVTRDYPPLPVSNGDFESGLTGWTEFSQQGWPLILSSASLPVAPRSGSWATWLGGDDDELAYIEQQVIVPTGASYLAYWHWISSVDTCGWDFGGVLINGVIVDVYDLCTTENTGGWVKHIVDLGAYQGQSVALQIRAETDTINSSSLYVDDVAFQSTPLPFGGPAPPQGPVGEQTTGSKPLTLERGESRASSPKAHAFPSGRER